MILVDAFIMMLLDALSMFQPSVCFGLLLGTLFQTD